MYIKYIYIRIYYNLLSIIIIMDNNSRHCIIEIINEIQSSNIINIDLKDEYFSTKYADFKKAHPVIFQTTIDGKMDQTMMGFMMSLLIKIENKDLDQTKASEEVGTLLFNKYVSPDLPNMKKTDIKNNEPKINIINGGENFSLSMVKGDDGDEYKEVN